MLVTPTSCKIFSALPDAQGVIRWSCVTPTPSPLPTDYKHLILAALYQDPTFLRRIHISQFFPPLLIGIAAVCFAVVGFILILRFIYFRKAITDQQVLLEIIPPADNTQSARPTEELFKKLHALATQATRLEAFIGHKKSYSLELVSTKEKGIRYIIRTNKVDAKVIKNNIIAYLPEAKVNTVEEYLPQSAKDISGTWNIYELNFQNHFALPLQEQTTLSKHDPIAYVTGHMTKLEPDETVVMQIVMTPVLEETHKREIKKIQELESYIYSGLDLTDKLKSKSTNIIFKIIGKLIIWYIKIWMLFVLVPILFVLSFFLGSIFIVGPLQFIFGKQKVQRSKLTEQQRHLSEIINKKISGELLEVSIRLYVKQKSAADFASRIKGLASSFASFSNDYYQRFSFHKPFRFIGFLKTWAFFKLQYRLLSLRNNPIISIQELSGLYHFPYATTTKTENIVKVHSKDLPAPLYIKSESPLDIVFAKNSYGGSTTQIGLTAAEREKHMYVIGATGTGKSTMLLSMVNQDLNRGKGLCLIDPHGELAEAALSCVPDNRKKDFIYFNPDDIKYPIGLNLLELTPGLEEDELLREKELITESVVSLFRKIFSEVWSAHAHRLEYILRNTIQTSLCLEDATIFTVYNLLTDPDFQKKALAKVEDENLLNFWKNEFGKAGDFQRVKMIGPITSRIGRFLFSPSAKRILEQKRSTINFDDILDSGKILICNLSKGKLGEDTSEVLGIMILTKVQLAALKRARVPQKARKPFYVYVDEFQTFATPSFIQMLSEARKYKVFLTMAEQSTSQQKDKNITNIILANVGTVVCFRSANPDDEKLMLPQFAPYVEKNEIMNLPSFHFYMKISAIKPEEPFSGETMPVEIQEDKEKIESLIQSSREVYAIKYVKPQVVKTSQKTQPKEDQKGNKKDPVKPATYLT